MRMVFEILSPLLFLIGLGSVALALVYLILRVRSGEGVDVSFRALVTVYFYLMTIVSFVVLLIGSSMLTNAALSTVLGREFSYRAPRVYAAEPIKLPPPPTTADDSETPAPHVQQPTVEEQEERRRRQLRKGFEEGLLRGASLSTVGGLVWGLHLWGRRRLEDDSRRRESFFYKAYLAVLLATASLVAVLSLPLGVYETLRYYIIEASELDSRDPPGGVLSTALVFTPVWAYYLRTLLQELRRSEAS